MKYFLKQIGFCLLYLFFMDSVAFGIDALESEFLKFLLYIANLGLFFFLMFVVSSKEGEEARKLLETNDAERRYMLETGELRPIDRAKEYTPFKGFFVGLCMCIPLVILLLIHLCIGIFGGTSNGVGVAAATCYMCFWMPYSVLFAGSTTIVAWGEYFAILYCVPLLMLGLGLPYILGAKKIDKQYRAFKDRSIR